MEIILKENEWAYEHIKNHDLGRAPRVTLAKVARYYLDDGYSKKEVRNKLYIFLTQCGQNYALERWQKAINDSMSVALKYPAIDVDFVTVSQIELDKIASLKSKLARRLAFTVLCLAKFRNEFCPNNNNWINYKDKDIMSLANVSVSIRRQAELYRSLLDAEMVKFPKSVDKTDMQVIFADDGEPALYIYDFRNLGYQYQMFCGEPYFECERCGVVTKIDNPDKGRRQKYCHDCAASIALQQRIDSVMRQRQCTPSEPKVNADTYTVYMHQCPNNKIYVGMTGMSLHNRWNKGLGYNNNSYFYTDIQKYGWENIKHYKIATVQDRNLAKDIESFFIQKYKSHYGENGYNHVSGETSHRYNGFVAKRYTPVEVDGSGHDIN